MKAILNKSTDLYQIVDEGEPVSSLPKFKRFIGGVGWAIPNKPDLYGQNWFVVVGEQEDNNLLAFVDGHGSLTGMTRQMVDWKDRLLVPTFYCDGAEIHNQKVLFLRQYEGLTFYKSEQTTFKRTSYPTPTSTWPYFREDRPTAAVVGVPDVVKADLEAGFDRICAMTTSKELGFRAESRIPGFIRSWLNQKKKKADLLDHPAIAASVFAVSMLLRTRPIEDKKPVETTAPYPNRRR